MRLDFKNSINNRRIIECIIYLLSKTKKGLGKYFIIKLLFLADKINLAQYGRTITRDNFVAMEYGPVGSLTKDILNHNKRIPEKDILFFDSLISSTVDEKKHPFFSLTTSVNGYPFSLLSKTDKNVLDLVYDKFHDFSFGVLKEMTHNFPEWKRHQEYLKEHKSAPIPLVDLLEEPILHLSKQQLETAKSLITE